MGWCELGWIYLLIAQDAWDLQLVVSSKSPWRSPHDRIDDSMHASWSGQCRAVVLVYSISGNGLDCSLLLSVCHIQVDWLDQCWSSLHGPWSRETSEQNELHSGFQRRWGGSLLLHRLSQYQIENSQCPLSVPSGMWVLASIIPAGSQVSSILQE